MFIDAKERKSMDARALMNLHNNRAGRQVNISLKQGATVGGEIKIKALTLCKTTNTSVN